MFTPPTDASAEPLRQMLWPIMSGLVHDLRQPLSVIDACADYLNLVLQADHDRSRQQLELLQEQVGEANRILHEALVNRRARPAKRRRSATSRYDGYAGRLAGHCSP